MDKNSGVIGACWKCGAHWVVIFRPDDACAAIIDCDCGNRFCERNRKYEFRVRDEPDTIFIENNPLVARLS